MNTTKHNPTDADMFRLWSKVVPDGDCWRYNGAKDKNGYYRIKLQGRKVYAHRLFFELAHGPVPEDRECCHTCQTRGCLNPYHMYAGTSAENTADCIRDGTHFCLRFVPEPRRGESHHAAVLTWEKVRLIREEFAAGARPRELMKRHGLSESNAYGIVNNTRWRE